MQRKLKPRQTPCIEWIASVGSMLILLTGCSTYHAEPITATTVQDELQPPPIETLRLHASRIKHPLLAPITFDERDGISPDEAAILAVLLNPSLRAARDQADEADAQLLQAGLLPNPELDASLESPIGGETKGTVNAYGLGLRWNATSLITHSARKEAAEASSAGVRLDIAWKEWQVAMAAKAAVYNLAMLDEQVLLAEEQVHCLTNSLAKVQSAVERGSRTGTDLSRAEKQYHQANTILLELLAQQAKQQTQLNRMVGLPATTNLTLQSKINWPNPSTPPGMDTLLKDLEQRRLDLLALRRGYESQEATVRAAILDQFPRIDIAPTLGRDTENVETAGLGLTITLPIFDRNQGRIAIERATRKRLFDEYAARVFEARSDVAMLRARIIWLNRELTDAEKKQKDLQSHADQLLNALTDGRTDALSYDAAAATLIESQMNTLRLQGERVQAIIALELATGLYRIPINEGPPSASNLNEETP